VVGAVLLDDFSGEGKRILSREDVAGFAHLQSDGSDDAVEGSNLGANVVSAMTGLDVFIVGAAIEDDVAFEFAVAGIGVVSHLIGVKDVVAVVNFGFAAEVVDGAIFFLLDGANGHGLFNLADCFRQKRGRRRSGFSSGYLGSGGGKGLAGYYGGSEKQMTDPCGRDKDSRAGDHFLVIFNL